MTLIVDAGPLVAMAGRGSTGREHIRQIIEEEPGSVVLPAYVAAEADYLILERVGADAQRLFLRDLASPTYEVEGLTRDEHRLAAELDERHPGLGLSDLSVVVLAARYRTRRLLTFDERDFRSITSLDGSPFVILPADSDGAEPG